MVCRGDGVVRDAAGRDEVCACTAHGPRDISRETSAGWAGEALAGIMRAAEARRIAAEEHAASCSDRPCKRCERFVCACGKPFEGAQNHRCRDCWTAEKLGRLVEAMRESVPKRFRWTFDADTDLLRSRVNASAELIKRALANPPSTDLRIEGDTKVGKTSLAVAMLDAWVRQDPERRAGAKFVESWWLVGARARHPLGQGEAPDVLEAVNATLLVLDDLGSEVDDGRGVMQFVIFRRHNEERPTWITTGFTAEQLMHRYGSQVIRRIVEHGKHVVLGAKP